MSTDTRNKGPVWLNEKRQLSLNSYNDMPLPKRGVHFWRYTDPSIFGTGSESDQSGKLPTLKGASPVDLGSMVTVDSPAAFVYDDNGTNVSVRRTDDSSESIVISSLSSAIKNDPSLIEKHLYSLVHNETGKLEALNGAMWNDGVVIIVPDNIQVKAPIHIVRQASPNGPTFHARLLIIVGKGSEVTILDEYRGGSPDKTAQRTEINSVVEIAGDENSQIQYATLQSTEVNSRFYLMHRARIMRDATIKTFPFVLGSSLSKQSFGVNLAGEGADSKMYGLLLGSGKQHLDNHTLHHHTRGNTTSDIDFKVVLRDKAMSAYTGLIRIDKSAPVCEAYQTNRNLLLSKGARSQAIPELEILNEEVNCSHGATHGRIDPEQLFYLRCRGISEADAVRMIVSGFVYKTLEKIPKHLSDYILQVVKKQLNEM